MKTLKSGVLNMLAVINRYKVFFIILALIALTALFLLFLSARSNSKVPSKGVFVMRCLKESTGQEGGSA